MMGQNAGTTGMDERIDRAHSFKFRRIFILLFCILLVLSLFRYHPEDIDYLAGGVYGVAYPRNLLGMVGARLSWFSMMTFGLGSYFLSILLLICSVRRLVWRGGLRKSGVEYPVCILLAGLGASLLFGLFPNAFPTLTANLNISTFPGGVLGHFFCAANHGWLYLLLNWFGSLLVGLSLLLIPLGVIWYYDWHELFKASFHQHREDQNEDATSQSVISSEAPETAPTMFTATPKTSSASSHSKGETAPNNEEEGLSSLLRNRPAPAVQPASGSPYLRRQMAQEAAALKEQDLPMAPPRPVAQPQNSPTETSLPTAPASPPPPPLVVPNLDDIEPGTPYQLPRVNLLQPPVATSRTSIEEEVAKTMCKLQETLDNFGFDAEVVGNIIGPQVTLFEISTAPGVNIDRFSHIQNTICMALEAVNIRMLLPIPGRNLVGIEVPNSKRANVSAYELLTDRKWRENKMEIPLLLGKNVNSETMMLDLARAPHLMIAGTTGSGKSVCMNLLITSMLFKFKPDELKLIMADPKVVEFQPYSTLPHLIVPVITEAEKVSLALRWAIVEMERRYRMLSVAKVRNLQEFNNRTMPEEPQLDEDGNPLPQKLPFIVIIIDEIADVMLHAQKDVEKALAAIVAKSRAVGIHTIIATQRPDTKVLTGTIKNNYPVRIAFQVPSQVDARTIMDTKGAESLLGRGDMLYKGNGMMLPERIQGGWVDTPEVENIVRYVSAFGGQHFDDSIFQVFESGATDGGDGGNSRNYNPDADTDDEEEKLIRQAVDIILRDRRPTISYLQRTMKIGYNKAATLIDELEDRGILGPQPSSGLREILVTGQADPFLQDDDQPPFEE